MKSLRPEDFVEISEEMPDWEAIFLKLVQQAKHIKYQTYTMPEIPEYIEAELRRIGYRDIILEENHWQHFLIPKRRVQ